MWNSYVRCCVPAAEQTFAPDYWHVSLNVTLEHRCRVQAQLERAEAPPSVWGTHAIPHICSTSDCITEPLFTRSDIGESILLPWQPRLYHWNYYRPLEQSSALASPPPLLDTYPTVIANWKSLLFFFCSKLKSGSKWTHSCMYGCALLSPVWRVRHCEPPHTRAPCVLLK